METPSKSYKPREVAEMLGCTVDHIYKMVKYGHLKAFKIGGSRNVRITDNAIKEFITKMNVRAKEMNG